MKRRFLALGLVALVPFAGSAGAVDTSVSGGASARSYAIKVIVPGGGAATAEATAPPDTALFGSPSGYADASWGSSVANASASAGPTSSASATADLTSLSLFNGEVTASGIRGRVQARATSAGGSGDISGSGVGSLTVGGQAVSTAPGARVALGDWGYAVILTQGASRGSTSYRGSVTALDIRLTADHGGLPAGTQIVAGYAEASVEAAIAPPPPPPRPSKPPAGGGAVAPSGKAPPGGAGPSASRGGPPAATVPPPLVHVPPNVKAKLTPGGYVFPVYGPSSFTNTFGAPRATTGWHHGEDIFAPLGAPILAVADGTLFSVGWNDVGGNRLWLRDEKGNEFYYAHLAAFSTLAVEGARVKAGAVIGFNGNSGDAQGTPYHLHFEIHLVSLLGLGYDRSAIPPYPHLIAWRRLEDIRFPSGSEWVTTPQAEANAPKPGAILLQVSDISAASGLRPGSVERAFVAPVAAEGDGALVRGGRFGTPPDVLDRRSAER